MIETLLSRDEGKTLEFKEDLSSPRQVVRSVVAFANTAGGTIVVGIQDRTKAVVGIKDALTQEERVANVLADCVQPQLIPDIQIHSWRDRELLVIVVPHSVGPYYVKAEGADDGVYVRLGSTNRRAGPETIAELRRLAVNVAFDELPRPDVNSEAVDFRAASEFLSAGGRSAGFGLARLALALRPSPTGHSPAFLRLTLGAASAILTACLERATPFGKDSRP
jgi:ATP-dependent DNA helicase RecG